MDVLKATLAPAVQSVVAGDAAFTNVSRGAADYAYMFARCTLPKDDAATAHARVLCALLRRHHSHLVVRGRSLTDTTVGIDTLDFVDGRYIDTACNLPPELSSIALPLRLNTPQHPHRLLHPHRIVHRAPYAVQPNEALAMHVTLDLTVYKPRRPGLDTTSV